MKRWITKGVVFFSFLLSPVGNLPAEAPDKKSFAKDHRFQRIRAYFARRSCPVQKYAADFVAAADRNQLDWRLLPSIALVESSGGKASRNNNIFGWDSARHRFPSVRAGIHAVAERLANAPQYRGKTLDEKLKTYNFRPHYGITVRRVMSQMAAEPI